jgi:hypothetical protein
MEAMPGLFCKLLSKVKIEKWKIALVPTALSILLLILAFSYPESRIRAEDIAARQELFSPSLNRELQRLISEDPNMLDPDQLPGGICAGVGEQPDIFLVHRCAGIRTLIQNREYHPPAGAIHRRQCEEFWIRWSSWKSMGN